MGNFIRLLGLLCFCVATTQSQGATYDIPGTNIRLTYENWGGGIVITDCNDDAEGALNIPASIGGKPVTAIWDYAFFGCRLSSVLVPASVERIRYGAFELCEFLEDVTLKRGVEIIEDDAFSRCYSLREITFPSSIESIGNYAFWDCPLDFVIFEGNAPNYFGASVFTPPNSTFFIYFDESALGFSRPEWKGYPTELLPSSFSFTENYQGYTITSSLYSATVGDLYIPATIRGRPVNQIGSGAFNNRALLESVAIPRYVNFIGNGAFSGCSNLTAFSVDDDSSSFSEVDGAIYNKSGKELVIFPPGKSGTFTTPAGVTSVRNYAFYDCNGLTEVQLSPDLSAISSSAFISCSSLTMIEADPANPLFTSVEGVLYDKAVSEIIIYPAARMEPTFVIPDTVTKISDRAFTEAAALVDIVIPDSVTVIGRGAFSSCASLTRVVISANITTIADYAFYNCSQLSSATFTGDAPENFGDYVFNSVATDFKTYAYEGTTGFTYPSWQGYSIEMLPNPNLDSDGDGWPDSIEVLLGTSTEDPNDRFRIWLTQDAGGSMNLHYEPHSPMCRFTVLSTNNLADPDSWETLPDLQFTPQSTARVATLSTLGTEQKYFRVEVSAVESD